MEFTNNIDKTREAIWDSMKNITFVFITASITIFVTMYFALINSGIENIRFILVLIFSLDIISSIFIWFYLYNNNKKMYLNFKIDIQEELIYDINKNIKIELNDNCQIIKNKNNIVVKNNKNEIVISKYINNKDELENILLSNNKAKQIKGKTFPNIIIFLSYIFFILLFFVRFINIFELYIFIVTGFVLTTLYATIYMIINIKKNHSIGVLINIGINIILVYYVSRNLFYTIKTLF